MTGISLLPQRFAAALVGSFGAIGLLLSCIGLYGVLAHDVTQRKRELGIRMALGARSAHVLRLVVRRAVVLVALGCLAGLGIAAIVTGFLRSFLYQVEPPGPGHLRGGADAPGDCGGAGQLRPGAAGGQDQPAGGAVGGVTGSRENGTN